MKRKIAYATITAVIATTAFFVGKNFTEQPTQPEAIPEKLERIELTAEKYGLFLEYTDGDNFYSFWINKEDLENAGLINLENIEGWETWKAAEEVGLEIQGDEWVYTIEKEPYTADKVEINRLY